MKILVMIGRGRVLNGNLIIMLEVVEWKNDDLNIDGNGRLLVGYPEVLDSRSGKSRKKKT